MRPILFTVTGTTIKLTNDMKSRGSNDAYPLLLKLIEDFPNRVIVVGNYRGELPDGLLDAISTDFGPMLLPGQDGVCEDEAELLARMDAVYDKLSVYDPLCWIDMWGPSPTWSWPYTPAGANGYDFSLLYSCMQLYLMNRIGAPRYGVVTDPKCYKRDGEFVTCWPGCTPRAVLSQEQLVYKRTIQRVPYTVHIAYAGCEFWQTYGMQRDSWCEKDYDVLVASNTHRSSSQLGIARRRMWDWLLDTVPDGAAICGHGWEPDEMLRFNYYGQLKSVFQVYDLMARSVGGPCVPQKVGFNTTKPRLYALHNCCPYLYGNGCDFTYDIDERILPLNHPSRWITGVPECDVNGTIEEVLYHTMPNFRVLHDLIAATEREEPYDEKWLAKFGGYVR